MATSACGEGFGGRVGLAAATIVYVTLTMTGAGGGGVAPQGDIACSLTMRKAVIHNAAEGRDLNIALDIRGGKVVGAFGNAPHFNKMPAELDTAGLAVADGKLTGVMKVSIGWDGWVPAGGNPYKAEYAVSAALADGRVEGRWSSAGVATNVEGAVAGTFAPRAPDTGTIRLALACANAVDHDQKIGGRGLKSVITLKDGKAVAVRSIPAGSIADVSCSMETPRFDLTLADGRLNGSYEVRITPQGVSPRNPVRVYSYRVSGVVIGDGAGGRMAIARDGEVLGETAVFTATARRGPPPPMGDCTYKMTFHHALGEGKFIDVYLASAGGKITGGFASSPNFNNAMHLVDASKLAIGEGRIAGDIGVTVLPDPWIPRDHKPVQCSFAVDCRVAGGEIAGRFKGKAGGDAVEQAIEGAQDDKVKLDNITGGTIRLENGLAGSGNHMARAFVSMQIKDGKVTGGNVGNNHDKAMKGPVTGGEFRLNGDEWSLKVEFTVDSAGGATPGKYVATASGTFVGNMSAGAFTCAHERGQVKEGSFWFSALIGGKKN